MYKIKNSTAFTIVELLVVIVVIGILAAMTFLSYTGISNKAITAGLKSDLSSASKKLKMYNVEYGYYPDSLDSNYCPQAPTADNNYCLMFTPGTTATYTGGGQSFQIIVSKSGQYFSISDDMAISSIVPVPAMPTMAVNFDGSNIVATINSSTNCPKGDIQYGIRSRVNDESWSDYSEWSDISNKSISASDGIKYSFQARSRCYLNAGEISEVMSSLEYSNARISTPVAPASIATNTNGDNTTWNWSAISCASGVADYQYLYTISPANYDSGWTNNGSANSATFTTNTEGQTYNVRVKARCVGPYATSDWSGESAVAYTNPVKNTWKKYNVAATSHYLTYSSYVWDLPTGHTLDYGSTYLYIGTGFTVNSDHATISMTGTKMVVASLATVSGGEYYCNYYPYTSLSPSWNGSGQAYIYEISQATNPHNNSAYLNFLHRTVTVVPVYGKSSFVGDVRAVPGTFPSDGQYSDGYWYVLQ